jgi:hypothetical protein
VPQRHVQTSRDSVELLRLKFAVAGAAPTPYGVRASAARYIAPAKLPTSLLVSLRHRSVAADRAHSRVTRANGTDRVRVARAGSRGARRRAHDTRAKTGVTWTGIDGDITRLAASQRLGPPIETGLDENCHYHGISWRAMVQPPNQLRTRRTLETVESRSERQASDRSTLVTLTPALLLAAASGAPLTDQELTAQKCQLSKADHDLQGRRGASTSVIPNAAPRLVSRYQEFGLGSAEPTLAVTGDGAVTYAPVFTNQAAFPHAR